MSGTDYAGMDLYAVLAELDGSGVPLAYMFVKKQNLHRTASAGSLTQVLDQFLRLVKDFGFSPSFVDCDKDRSEINAIQQVWPSARFQLCLWHAKRAIQAKLKDSTKADSLFHYWPGEAQDLVLGLENC